MFRYIPLFSHSKQLDCSWIPRLIDWLLTIAVRVELCGKEIYFNWVNKKMPFYRTSEIRLLLSACSPDQLLSLKKINIFNREYFSHIIPIPATARVALVAFMADWQLLRSRPQVRNLAKISGHFVVLDMWNWMSEWLCVDLDNLYSWICWHRWGDPVCVVNVRIQCPNDNVVPISLRCGSRRQWAQHIHKSSCAVQPTPKQGNLLHFTVQHVTDHNIRNN